jgi:hypothetical protein
VVKFKVALQGSLGSKGLLWMASAAPHAAVDVGLVSEPGRPGSIEGVGGRTIFERAHIGLNIPE